MSDDAIPAPRWAVVVLGWIVGTALAVVTLPLLPTSSLLAAYALGAVLGAGGLLLAFHSECRRIERRLTHT